MTRDQRAASSFADPCIVRETRGIVENNSISQVFATLLVGRRPALRATELNHYEAHNVKPIKYRHLKDVSPQTYRWLDVRFLDFSNQSFWDSVA